MKLKDNEVNMFSKMALVAAAESRAVRKKVGAILVTETGIVLPGFNGTPAGFDNTCEIEVEGELVTKPEVLHAESNALAKAGKEGIRLNGSTVFVTMSPCVECSKLMIQNGIKTVFYSEEYRDRSGLELLDKAGVEIVRFNFNDKWGS